MNADRIVLRGMTFRGNHGVFPEEQRLGQEFVVDVELEVDVRAAARMSDLTRTVDYTAVYDDVRRIVEGPPSRLIETVAEAIAERILGYQHVRAVGVRVSKPQVALPGPVEFAAVELYRRRSDRPR